MRKLMLCLAGAAAMVLLTPTLSNAAPLRADAAPAVHKPIDEARLVRRCHMGRVWRTGPHGRRLVPMRVCRTVHVR